MAIRIIIAIAAIATTQSLVTTTPKPHVLILPAQFLVPADYKTLERKLEQEGFPSASTTPLTRLDWLKVIPSSPPTKFISGTLDPSETLEWYYNKIETQLNSILQSYPPSTQPDGVTRVAFVGHSIGGWVARSYIGGLSLSDTAVGSLLKSQKSLIITSLTTLGSPMKTSPNALVDQTRGLLKNIENSPTCSKESMKIPVNNIASNGVQGKLLTTNVEELIAASGYWSLNNDPFSAGDGIVPLDVASIDGPAKVLNNVKHAGHIPTPYNIFSDSKSIELGEEEYGTWYGSDSIVPEWTEFLT